MGIRFSLLPSRWKRPRPTRHSTPTHEQIKECSERGRERAGALKGAEDFRQPRVSRVLYLPGLNVADCARDADSPFRNGGGVLAESVWAGERQEPPRAGPGTSRAASGFVWAVGSVVGTSSPARPSVGRTAGGAGAGSGTCGTQKGRPREGNSRHR